MFEEFNYLAIGVYILDEKHRIIFWNQQMEELVGVPFSKIQNKHCGVLEFYDDEELIDALDFNSCVSAKGEIKRQVYLKTKDGQVKAVYISLSRFSKAARNFYILSVTNLIELVNCDFFYQEKIKALEKSFHGIVGQHDDIKRLQELIRLTADSETNVLISGESGTGKELIASAIHKLSRRRTNPIIKVNCASLSESILESELFGHVKGAFTGAISDKIGKFEAAQNGSIFLDEIAEISPKLQAKLLRVIQHKNITRVGENKEREINIRIIAATNKELSEMVSNGSFREDLYYRLNVFPIRTTALRERLSDLPLLIDHFITLIRERSGKQIYDIGPKALRHLMHYEWKGNVRELENVLEYAFVLAQGKSIRFSDLPPYILQSPFRSQENGRQQSHNRNELLRILEEHGGSRKKTAEALQISTVTLWKRMKTLKLI